MLGLSGCTKRHATIHLAANATGWRGLTELGRSGDELVADTAWFVLFAGLPRWFVLSIGAAILALWSRSHTHRGQRPVTPPASL